MHSVNDEETAALYALGLLDREELATFEPHLAQCVDCQRTVRQDRQTVALLDVARPQADPPPALKSRLIARAALDLAGDDRRTEHSARQSRWAWLRPRAGWSVALAPMFVLMLGLGFAIGQHFTLDEVLLTVPLQGTSLGSMVVVHRSGVTDVELRGLADPPSAHLYQAWIVSPDGARIPAGTYDDGHGTYTLTESAVGRRVEITIEAAPGAEKPTSNPLLWADVVP